MLLITLVVTQDRTGSPIGHKRTIDVKPYRSLDPNLMVLGVEGSIILLEKNARQLPKKGYRNREEAEEIQISEHPFVRIMLNSKSVILYLTILLF